MGKKRSCRSNIIGKPGDNKIVRAFADAKGMSVKSATHFLLETAIKAIYEHPEKYTFKEAENAGKNDTSGGNRELIPGG